MTMKSVGKAALAMVEEVRRQFKEKPGIMAGTEKPEYAKCITISTEASLREMVLPGILVILTPILTGFIFGTKFLTGVLVGALLAGIQFAIAQSNSGGALKDTSGPAINVLIKNMGLIAVLFVEAMVLA